MSFRVWSRESRRFKSEQDSLDGVKICRANNTIEVVKYWGLAIAKANPSVVEVLVIVALVCLDVSLPYEGMYVIGFPNTLVE